MSTRNNNACSLEEIILSRSGDSDLPCEVAFNIASELNVSADEVGKIADRLKIRLVKCQLGLFGYKPEKKIVTPASSVDEKLQGAIRDALSENRISCKRIWHIAEALSMPKMKVSGACEAMGIKIKPCQLGAF